MASNYHSRLRFHSEKDALSNSATNAVPIAFGQEHTTMLLGQQRAKFQSQAQMIRKLRIFVERETELDLENLATSRSKEQLETLAQVPIHRPLREVLRTFQLDAVA
jgi:hypothetical protein